MPAPDYYVCPICGERDLWKILVLFVPDRPTWPSSKPIVICRECAFGITLAYTAQSERNLK